MSMARFIFVPVVSPAMLRDAGIAAAFLGGAKILRNPHESGWKKGFERRFGTGCLSEVGANDSLYVVCHGAGHPGSKQIGEKRADGNLKTYTMAELATVIAAESLTKRFRDLHMFTCGSGLMNKNAVVDVPKKAGWMLGIADTSIVTRNPELSSKYQQQESIARTLFDAMRAEGYHSIQVTGYLGDIVTRPPDRITVEEYFGGEEHGLDWKLVVR
jgi:hypothetical protein